MDNSATDYTRQREFQFPCEIFGGGGGGASEVRLVVRDDDGGNGRVAHDVLADAALGREA